MTPAPACRHPECGQPCIRTKGGAVRWRQHCADHSALTDTWPLPPPILPDEPNPAWRLDAACEGMNVDLFFPTSDNTPPVEVIEACSRCPVRGDCALEDMTGIVDQMHGIRGGMSRDMRLKMRRRLQRRRAS